MIAIFFMLSLAFAPFPMRRSKNSASVDVPLNEMEEYFTLKRTQNSAEIGKPLFQYFKDEGADTSDDDFNASTQINSSSERSESEINKPLFQYFKDEGADTSD